MSTVLPFQWKEDDGSMDIDSSADDLGNISTYVNTDIPMK